MPLLATSSPAHAAWWFAAEPPAEWPVWVSRNGGGFFHTPAGLRAGAPSGEPIFGAFMRRDHVVGIVAGVRAGCALSPRQRHFHFPSLPALQAGEALGPALEALVETAAAVGAAELRSDGFDSHPDWAGLGEPADRIEYHLRLEPDPAPTFARLHSNHRRTVRRGDEAGWEMRTLIGPAAADALERVTGEASARSAARGTGYAVTVPRVALDPPDPAGRWGATTYAAFAGPELLAAALVGWADGRAYYVCGGATAQGYDLRASIWLHWRISRSAAESGATLYNLGGTPATAARPDDPAHGLYRFKTGFGSTVVPRRRVERILDPGHLRHHRLLDRAVSLVRWG